MIESILPDISGISSEIFHYAVQTVAERKKGGGLGRCDRSFWKHDHIERFLFRQLPVITKRGKGVIIDMHAGDGYETPHPQPDFFAGGSLKTSPTIAIAAGRKYKTDVILCESNRQRRQGLIAQFGDEARIIGNHSQLMDMESMITQYAWLIAISDPNGHGDQGVDVMQWLIDRVAISDVIAVVNCNSIKRCLGLTNPDHFLSRVRLAHQSVIENQWMLDPDQWRVRLRKKQVLSCGPTRLSNNMEALIVLVSNFIPGHGK